MKIDLLKIYEENKKENEEFEKVRKDHEFKKELNNLISSIVNGNECFETNNDNLLEKLNISKVKNKRHSYWIGACKYEVKLNKTNIKRVQKYLDEENK